ncbi:Crp/Fnr family transcriptional regulator [Streptomyces sp. NPDC020096]
MARLPEELRQTLLLAARPTQYDAGELLLMQGEKSTHVCVLSSVGYAGSSACAKISVGLANGTESLLGIRVSGDVVGESAAVRGSARSATVTACSPVRVHALTQQAFLGFLNTYPTAWQALACVLADRLEAANRRRLDFAAFNVVTRLARVLVELVERHGVSGESGYEPGVHLSQAELGRLIGAREDAVQLAMRQLQHGNMVVVRYRRVSVTDLDELRRFTQVT